MIRTKTTMNCPFGLPIPKACGCIGELINKMKPGQRNPLMNGGAKCPYAEDLNEEKGFVNCNYADSNAGMGGFNPQHGSPLYPRLWEGFNTINLDRQYHNYRDFSYFSLYGAKEDKTLMKMSSVGSTIGRCRLCGTIVDGSDTIVCENCNRHHYLGHDWLGEYGSGGRFGSFGSFGSLNCELCGRPIEGATEGYYGSSRSHICSLCDAGSQGS